MIKLWRFLSVPIIVAVCLGLLLVPAAISPKVASAQTLNCGIEVVPNMTKVGYNEDFSVDIRIIDTVAQEIAAWTVYLEFNTTLMNVTGITPIVTLPTGQPADDAPGYPSWNNATGVLEHQSGTGPGDPYVNTSFDVMTVHFRSNNVPGTGSLDFKDLSPIARTYIMDRNATPVLNWTMVVNGTVIVGVPTLTVNVTPAGGGNVTINNTITPSSYPNTTNWPVDEVVDLEAIPSAGWAFVNWSGNLTGSTNPTSITMDDDKSVTANFAEQPPALSVSPSSLTLAAAPGATDTTTYTVTNSGGGNLSWNSSNVTYGPGATGWLTQNITDGILTANVSDTVLVTANATGLTAGIYTATINITGNSSVELPVTLNVGVPAISVSPTPLTFTTNEGVNPPSQMLEVCNSGSGILDWSLTDNAGWLSATPGSGSLGADECDDVTVSVDVSGMEAGEYTATITITGSEKKVPVTLYILSALPDMLVGPAQLSASALSITPQQVQSGQDVTISINVANTGGETGSYNAVLYINGVVEDSQSVSVAAGISKNVIFTVTKTKAGVYDVALAGQNGQFEVVGGGGWFGGGGLGTGGIIAIVVIVIILIAAVVFILRGTTKPE